MRKLQRSLAAVMIVAFYGASASTVAAQSEADEAPTFPAGTFVADFRHPDRFVEFAGDGTCRWQSMDSGWERACTYVTDGDTFTEVTSEWPDGAQIPATYSWDFDGQLLSFELVGEDPRSSRFSSYARYPLRMVEDGRVVFIAYRDVPPGELVAVRLRLVADADLPPGAISELSDLLWRTAAVAIERGQPITPDMLEPLADD